MQRKPVTPAQISFNFGKLQYVSTSFCSVFDFQTYSVGGRGLDSLDRLISDQCFEQRCWAVLTTSASPCLQRNV